MTFSMELADPLYEIPIKCPVCNTEAFFSYRLKSKCQSVTLDDLNIPAYTGVRGFADADFLPMAAAVCPRCLYASTLAESFTRLGGMVATETVRLRDSLQEDLLMSRSKRVAILTRFELTPASFARPRGVVAAYGAYLLVAQSAEVKALHGVARALSEVATAYLYSYAFAAQVGGVAAQSTSLELAAQAYAKVFESGDHDPKNVDQVIYLCIALYLRLGWRDEAKPFQVAFERLRDRVRDIGGDQAKRVKVYQEKINDLWHA